MGGGKIPLHDMAEPITLTLKYMTQVSLSHSPLNTIWGGGGGKLPHVTQLSLSHSPLNTIQCRKKFPFMTWLSLSHSPLNIKYNGEGKKTYVTRLSLSEVTGGLLGRVMDSMSGASSWMVSPFTCTEMRAILGSWRWVRYTPSAVATVQCLQINHFTTFPSDNGVINTQPNYDWQNAIS